MWLILTCVLGTGALIAYFKGAREGKQWGTPALVLLVIATVGTAIVSMTGSGGVQVAGEDEYEDVRVLAEAFQGELPSKPKVLIIRSAMTEEEEDVEKEKRMALAAIQETLGSDAELVGFVPPGLSDSNGRESRDIAAFNAVFEEYSDENVDLCIATVKPPEQDMHNLKTDLMPADMLLGLCYQLSYNPEEIDQWISDGVIDGVSLYPPNGDQGLIAITSDTIDQLPSESPL
ncbi:MAG: hypothetical protein ACOC0A_05380 [Planctomycetota bacterium]